MDYPQSTWSKSFAPGRLGCSESYTPARIGPLILSELRDHARIPTNDDDNLLIRYANEAQERLEDELGRVLLTASVVEYYDVWPWDWQHVVHLHRAPVASVTSITYYDPDDAQQTWSSANYDVDIITEPARITVAESATLSSPAIDQRPNCVAITYSAGYGSTLDSLPNVAVVAIMKMAMYSYDCGRGIDYSVDAAAVERLWQQATRNLMWRAS